MAAVDHGGGSLDSYVTRTCDKETAFAFMKRMLKPHGPPEAITPTVCAPLALTELGSREQQQVGR